MTLRAVYRSYGGENTKNRPPYYSKSLTLLSFVRAISLVSDVDVVFVNDGPIPSDRLAIMHRFGRVIQISDRPQGMRASYRFALGLADRECWANGDVVSFNEDDYLYTAEAFSALGEAATHLTSASYFSLYGDRPDYTDLDARNSHSLPRAWTPAPDLTVDGRRWFNRPSITSTFAARVGALREDLPIFHQCMRPFRRRYLDHETCLLYQACVPYSGIELLTGLPNDFERSLRGVVRTLVLAPFRIALNVRARRQPEPHRLYVLTPNEATHLEHPVISPDQDWPAVATEVLRWAETQGLPGVDPIRPHQLDRAQ
jgi:hypothetical protein